MAAGARRPAEGRGAAAIPTLTTDLATWVDIDRIAWGQRYAVVTASRILYTLATAEVASKAGALEWAQRTLDARWRPLLAQVRDERARGLGARTSRRGPARRTRRGPSRRTPWSGRRRTTSLRP